MTQNIVITHGLRTPQGLLGGALRDISAQQLGEWVVRELINRSQIASSIIDEVIFGCIGQFSDAPNIARVVALKAGLPVSTPAYTVQRNCASGIQSIVSAFQNIQSDEGEIYIAGGTESMSSAPFVNRDLRFGKRLRHSELIDSLWEGLTDPVCDQVMGRTAENLAEEFKISREEQDLFAVKSHKKAFRATREGKFKEEIVTLSIPKKAAGKEVTPETFIQDEGPNIALTEQMLALYPTIFKEDGTVTPGNSCPISDGAAAMLVMTEKKATELGFEILGNIKSFAFAGVEPERMGIGPVLAVPKALKKAGLELKDMDLIEINEAFAAQTLAVGKTLKWDWDKVNVNGGAIALGHPVGATGTRLIISLLHEMRRQNLKLGLATLCVGGGQGAAIILERK
jgi:acetyl-CoA C-acetyltransferase